MCFSSLRCTNTNIYTNEFSLSCCAHEELSLMLLNFATSVHLLNGVWFGGLPVKGESDVNILVSSTQWPGGSCGRKVAGCVQACDQ